VEKPDPLHLQGQIDALMVIVGAMAEANLIYLSPKARGLAKQWLEMHSDRAANPAYRKGFESVLRDAL